MTSARTWTTEVPERDGLYAFVHIVRGDDDPDRRTKAPSLGGAGNLHRDHPTHWSQVRKISIKVCAESILGLLADGVARTFNRIGVELWDKTADILLESNADDALWGLVASGDIEHTMAAPIYFRPTATTATKETPMMTATERAKAMIREGREALGLTQTEAADKLGVSQAEWSRWETGPRGVTLARIEKIADALGLELAMSLTKPAKKRAAKKAKPRAPSKRRRS